MIDPLQILYGLLLVAAGWGLLRFVREVDLLSATVRDLQEHVAECCDRRTAPERRKAKPRPKARR